MASSRDRSVGPHISRPEEYDEPTCGPGRVVRTASHEDLVDVAPAPVFTGLKRLDDGMPDSMRVQASVSVRGGIAAANVAAGQAQSKMHPRRPGEQTLRATLRRLRYHRPHHAQVRVVGRGHPNVLPRQSLILCGQSWWKRCRDWQPFAAGTSPIHYELLISTWRGLRT